MPTKKPTLPTELSIFSRYLWGGDRYRIAETLDDAFGLVCADGTGRTRSLPREDVEALLKCGDLVEEPGIFDAYGKLAERGSPYLSIAACEPRHHKTILRRLLWARRLDRDWKAGNVKLTEAALAPYIAEVHGAIEAELGEMFGEKARKPRRGQPTGIAAPSVSALKRDHLIFRRPGFAPSDFRPKTDNCIYGGKRLDPDRKVAVLDVIRDIHANEGRMTLSGLKVHLKAVLPNGMAAPDEETLSKIIKEMPEARQIASRFGLKAMVEQRGMFSEGPRYSMVGEMVYLDCWKTDIVVLLKECGVWMRLSRNVRKRMESVLKDRVWVCVAMCMASRAILGIAFDIAETPELTRRTLRMAVSDRGIYAEMAGCEGEPIPQVGVAGIRHDSGPAFTDKDFHFAALAVSGDTAIGIVNRPRYRGGLERFFGTVAMQLLPYFSGRTFSNVVERGDYDSHERASLILEAFGNAFFKYVNDVYHLRGHAWLADQPPADFFTEALMATGCPDLMDSHQLRLAFGYRKEATLTGEGLRFMGIQYQAKWLGSVRRDRLQKMTFMVDPVDLGCISVLHDNAWHTVPGPVEMKGVGLTQWMRTCRQLKEKHGAQADVHWPIVAAALKDFAALGAKSKVEAQLLDTGYDSDFLDRAEAAMTLRLVFRPSPSAFVAPLSITEGGLGTGFAVQSRTSSVSDEPIPPNDDLVTDDDHGDVADADDEVEVNSDLLDGPERDVGPDVGPDEEPELTPPAAPAPPVQGSGEARPAPKKARRIFLNEENEGE